MSRRYIPEAARFTQVAVAVIDGMITEDGVSTSGRREWCYAAVDGAGRAWYCDFDGMEKARWRPLPEHPDLVEPEPPDPSHETNTGAQG